MQKERLDTSTAAEALANLAAAAARRLLQEDIPPEMSRAQLRLARVAYGGLALADRVRGVRLRRR